MMSFLFQTKILPFHKLFANRCSRSQSLQFTSIYYSQKRHIKWQIKWHRLLFLDWFVAAFNRVDKQRLALLGPDCVCAEWLLRNGAAVRFVGQPTLLSDYNELMKLEETESAVLKVEEIYAKESGLSAAGFDHFKGCNHVKKITLIFCTHLFDSALFKLNYVKDSLQYLEVRSCFNIKDEGVKSLGNLKNLKILILADLFSVRNKDECEVALKKALPQCNIKFEK